MHSHASRWIACASTIHHVANVRLFFKQFNHELMALTFQSTPHRLADLDAPPWQNLWGPNQWPSPETLPEFRSVFEDYMRRMSAISMYFTSLVAESIGLDPSAFEKFFDRDQQHKLKLV